MKPDLDAILARLLNPNLTAEEFESIMAILSCIEERESPTTYTIGETEWVHRIATLEQELRDARAAFESCNRARRHCEDECASLRARACITNDAGEASLINTLEHMLAEERENVDTLRARVAELEAEVAVLRPWSVMLKRAHGALTDAGCVVPLEFDQSIEHAIKDLARRATRAEQLFVDEYDERKAAEREIAELKARITTLEAMR